MNTRQNGSPPPPAPITLRDVYYVLFRHKWLIAVLAALGVAGSLAVYALWPFPYTTQAKVFIRYIQDITDSSDLEGAAKVRSPDDRGANILNTELEILTSTDLALQVATNLGPDKILGQAGASNSMSAAAAFITSHLLAEVPKNCDVIILRYSARDPMVAQQVLSGLISAYKRKYVEIHLERGFTDTYLESRTDESKAHLQNTLKTLEEEKEKIGITSLPDAKKNTADQAARTTESIFQTQAELAEAAATVKDLQERIGAPAPNAAATNHPAGIAPAAPAPPASPDIVAKYQSLNTILNSRLTREQELLTHFTTNNVQVQVAQKQRAAAEADVKQFEAANPGLLALKASDLGRPGFPLAPVVDLNAELRDAVAKQHALSAKYKELTNILARVQDDAKVLDAAENKIMQAESEKEVADARYKHFQLSADQARNEEAVANKVSNISTAEQPTAPVRDSNKIFKLSGGVLGFFLALAFGLPFFIELVLDQSLKQPSEVQARIGAPFFITLPRTNGHGNLAALKQSRNVPLLPAPGSETAGPGTGDKTALPQPANGQVAAWDQRHELRPFFETLRDRLMTYFEMINLTHKPKLVAVTSCGQGAGVTTTAAGLASSLSETGDGNVLLVNMNVRDGQAHHFYKGQLACGIEEALEKDKRDQAQVRDNLYVAKEMEAEDDLPRVLPKRFSHLVPKMKASDFDYIIFDMPPVSEISITPRLARFMDMVLLVIESEKTSRDAATRVASLLTESKTNVGLVLNKNRSYVPKRLEQRL